MSHFLLDAYHPVIGWDWKIDPNEMEQFKEAGFRGDIARQQELYAKWKSENVKVPVPKPKADVKPAPVKRRLAYGMT